jgi:hypothetical protein
MVSEVALVADELEPAGWGMLRVGSAPLVGRRLGHVDWVKTRAVLAPTAVGGRVV